MSEDAVFEVGKKLVGDWSVFGGLGVGEEGLEEGGHCGM